MKRQKTLLPVLLLAAIGLLVLSGCAGSAQAQTPVPANTPRTITVVGNGQAFGSPDVATVQVGVQTRNANAGDAVSENNTKMQALIDAIKALGIAEKDIQTTNFSVYAQQDASPTTGEALKSITYVVDNTVSITVRDVGQLGDVLDKAVQAGANNVYGISFSVADKSALEETARQQAMSDARTRAEQLAKLAGVSLDAPLSISEAFSGGQPIFYGGQRALAADAASVPVQSGQIEVDLQVNVTYTIK